MTTKPKAGPDREKYGSGGMRFDKKRGKYIASTELPPEPGSGRRRRLEAAGPTAAQARSALKEKQKKLAEGKTGQVRGGDTVASWLATWIDVVTKDTIRPTTRRSYRSVIDHHIVPTIGHKKLKTLEPADIRYMMSAILERVATSNTLNPGGRQVSGPRRANYAKTVLAKSLGDAIRDGRAGRNVATKEYVDKIKIDETPPKALTAAQAIKTLMRAEANNDQWIARWATALMLGVRQGETLGLQWSRVDFSTMEIEFTRQLQVLESVHGCGEMISPKVWPCGRGKPTLCPDAALVMPTDTDSVEVLDGGPFAFTPPKTVMSKRAVPMPMALAQALWAHHEATKHIRNPHDLVWHNQGRPIHYTGDYERWIELLDNAGMERIKLHSTRHSAASILLEMGVDKEVIREILGHTSVNTTAGYARAGQDFRREVMAKTGGLLGGMFDNVVIDAEVVEQRELS